MRKALTIVAIFALASCLSLAAADNKAIAQQFKAKGYKIAYVLNGTSTEIFKMAFDGAIQEGSYYGIKVDVFTSDGDDVRFQDIVSQCAQQGYQAMIISHGKPQYSYDLVNSVVAKGIKVVTFDTVIHDSNGKGIPGVTTMFQSDQEMARLTLDYICDVLYKGINRPIRVLKLWRGPGIPPFDRRQETYKKFEDAKKIITLEVLGPSNPADQEGSLGSVVASILPKYPKGTVDVIWSAYDAYGRGAYKALTEANRTDIPLVSIDISNQDINYMRAPDKIWKICVATHFPNVGISAVRLAALKLNGDITPDQYILQPSVIEASKLTPDANVINLDKLIPGYGLNNDNILPWMAELRRSVGAK
ncbi:MAG: substrate-binding domain-containing protein [Rectinemataceae bacterium]|jgi:simple sugar transport system substrate-binding protein